MRYFTVTYNVYADVVLANNFTIDFLLLTVVKKVMKLETRKGGIFLASMAGAFYALAVTIFPFPVFFSPVNCYILRGQRTDDGSGI